jgi:hypothetical protein
MNRHTTHGARSAVRVVALVLSTMTVLATIATLGTTPASAGGFIDQIDLTAPGPSPLPGQVAVPLVPIKWDARTIPVQYRVNDLDPIPNPLGAPVITQPQAAAVFQGSMDRWNDIRTSFIEMRIVGDVTSAQPAGFDFVNELTFVTSPGFNAIAVSPSVSLTADATLTDGLDIDGDGDSDVSSAISVATDVDSDGDIEFPAGSYPAGTILDNDVSFNAAALRFTIADGDADANTSSVDLEAIAVHELGHSHGLSHTLIDQVSASDGSGSTMFPFIDTGDPVAELQQRDLHEDDIATSSLGYPEGTAASGPAKLQPGDLAFAWVYSTLTGEVTDPSGQGIAGADVSAYGYLTGTRFVGAYSGTTQLSYNPATGQLFLVSPSFNVLDGKYVLPVRTGLYSVRIEAVDGTPVPASSVNFNAIIGSALGQLSFTEEAWNGNGEGAVETSPGHAVPLFALAGFEIDDIDFTTNVQGQLAPYGALNFVGFTGVAPGSYYAVRIPGADLLAALASYTDPVIHGITYRTQHFDASVPTVFAEAAFAYGEVSEDGTTAEVNVDRPIVRDRQFVAQPGDFSPFWFGNKGLTRRVERALERDPDLDVFLVLRVPTDSPFPGVSGFPPLIGLDGGVATNDAPIFGLSYLSTDDGATFNRSNTYNYMFSLVVSEAP